MNIQVDNAELLNIFSIIILHQTNKFHGTSTTLHIKGSKYHKFYSSNIIVLPEFELGNRG